MSQDIVIKVEHISKKYCKSLKRSMVYGLTDILKNTVNLSSHSEKLRQREFWALDDISFEVKQGETLGIIGPNGSGKTTLLKMLNGIFWPDKGKITIKGRVGALIEVGAGFHPLLTGRENIYLNGAILGIGKDEIDKKFDAIIDFADIGDFLDTPVKFYSSGMFVRLGFAVAVHCEPNILLIDEVLAVGDLAFRVKCFNKMAEMTKDCTIVIVSHNMSALARMTSKCIVLEKGHTCFLGPSTYAIQNYYSLFDKKEICNQYLVKSVNAEVKKIVLCNVDKEETESFQHANSMTISFDVKVAAQYKTFLISVMIIDYRADIVAQCDSKYNNIIIKNDGYTKNVQITIPKLLLNPGRYNINITIFDESHQKYLYWNHNAKMFKVIGKFIGNASIQLQSVWEIN